MSERVDSSAIEGIVGVKRHPVNHYGRAVSAEQTVYVLHSQRCVDEVPDLNCAYTAGLDEGIDVDRWVQDASVVLAIEDSRLVPSEPVETP